VFGKELERFGPLFGKLIGKEKPSVANGDLLLGEARGKLENLKLKLGFCNPSATRIYVRWEVRFG